MTTSSRRDPLIVIGVCFLPLIFTAAYSLFRGDRVADYTTGRVVFGIVFELVVGIGGILFLRWREFPLQVLRVRFSMDAIVIGGLLGLLLIPMTGIVYNVALRIPGFANLGVREFRDSAPFALTLIFLVINSWFEESFVMALPVAMFPEWRAGQMILFTSLLRVSYHVYQGPAGTLAIFAFGAAVAAVYWRTRDLSIPILAHTVMNVVLSGLRHNA
jgi:membrane protease YdiL (CAAX protease family)